MDQEKIGRFITALRKEKNLTQQELGEKLGVTNKTVSRWENGVYVPDIEMIQLLGKQFDVSVNEIIAGERISEEHFKEKAEENLISTIKSASNFTLKEKIVFFKRKWIKEHSFSIILSVITVIAFLTIGFMESRGWICSVGVIVGLLCYIWLYNRMMIYVERNVFGPKDTSRG